MEPASLLRPKACAAYLGIGERTLWHWVELGKFPPPIKLSGRAVAWLPKEVAAWVEAQPRHVPRARGPRFLRERP